MSFIVADGVSEYSSTTGTTRPYALSGAVAGNSSFAESVGNNDTFNFYIYDGPRYERGRGQYDASTNTIATLSLTTTSNGGSPVNWPTSGRRIILLETAASSYLLSIYNDDAFWISLDTALYTDLGRLREVAYKEHDMGTLNGVLTDFNSGDIYTIDLGRGTTPDPVAAEVDDVFWSIIEVASGSDLGNLREDVMKNLDMGRLAGAIGNTVDASVRAIDLGRS